MPRGCLQLELVRCPARVHVQRGLATPRGRSPAHSSHNRQPGAIPPSDMRTRAFGHAASAMMHDAFWSRCSAVTASSGRAGRRGGSADVERSAA